MGIRAFGVVLALAGSAAAASPIDWNDYITAELGRGYAPARPADARPAAGAPGRSLTIALLMARRHWDELTPATRQRVAPYLQRPAGGGGVSDGVPGYRNPARVTSQASAHFRVHYIDRTLYPSDPDAAAPAYVTQVLAQMENVWNVEHGQLGYAPVPSDAATANNGGDGLYDVYLLELYRPRENIFFYGLTNTDNVATDDPNRPYGTSSYLLLDDDFASDEFGFADPSLPLRVTAAHEYFHAIQFGYDYWEDAAFMEQSSTWMEDMVYPDIHDNYQYLGEPYTDSDGNGQYDTGEPFTDRNGDGTRGEGSAEFPEFHLDAYDDFELPGYAVLVQLIQYGRFLWPRFLTERYGAQVVRATWEQCARVEGANAFEAADAALAGVGGSLSAAYQEYATWNYDVDRYADGANYPRAWIDTTDSGGVDLSSTSSPSLSGMADAGYAVQMHLSTVYQQIRSPVGTYHFTATGGLPALTLLVDRGSGALDAQVVDLNAGSGTWTAPAGALRAVAVISNTSHYSDGMSWSLRGGEGGSSEAEGGGGTVDPWALLGLAGLAAALRRRGWGTA